MTNRLSLGLRRAKIFVFCFVLMAITRGGGGTNNKTTKKSRALFHSLGTEESHVVRVGLPTLMRKEVFCVLALEENAMFVA